jgi:serine protease Do
VGNSDTLRVGEWVLAIGSPFGLDMTVTSGIVSASGRGNVGIGGEGFYADFIQTDAAINPGNSGGPLLNMRGEVVGVNTAILSRSGGNNGIGFSIPINMVKYVVDELREHGTVTRGFLGVGIQQVTPDLAKWFELEAGTGVIVSSVQPDSPADKAGIRQGDIILSFNGMNVTEVGSFRSRVSITPAGTKAPVVVLREGERVELTVELGTAPQSEVVARADSSPATVEDGDFGLAVQNLTDDIASRLGYEDETGVVVAGVQPGSPAERAGMKPGQLIKKVNKQDIRNTRDYEEALKEGRNDTVLLLVQEEEGQRYVTLRIA